MCSGVVPLLSNGPMVSRVSSLASWGSCSTPTWLKSSSWSRAVASEARSVGARSVSDSLEDRCSPMDSVWVRLEAMVLRGWNNTMVEINPCCAEFTSGDIKIYCQTSNIRCTLVGNIIVDHSDVVGALPVDAAPITSSFSTWLEWIGQRQLQDEMRII